MYKVRIKTDQSCSICDQFLLAKIRWYKQNKKPNRPELNRTYDAGSEKRNNQNLALRGISWYMVEYSVVLVNHSEYTPREPRSSDQALRGDFCWQHQRSWSGSARFASIILATHTPRPPSRATRLSRVKSRRWLSIRFAVCDRRSSRSTQSTTGHLPAVECTRGNSLAGGLAMSRTTLDRIRCDP